MKIIIYIFPFIIFSCQQNSENSIIRITRLEEQVKLLKSEIHDQRMRYIRLNEEIDYVLHDVSEKRSQSAIEAFKKNAGKQLK